MAFINDNNKGYFYLLAVFIIFMLFLTVFSDKGLIKIYHLSKERDSILAKNVLTGKENEDLKNEINRLKTDKRYIEEIARKELGMVRTSDIIYHFEE